MRLDIMTIEVQKNMIYVVIVSDHNLPNLLAVLAQPSAPERVLMVATSRFVSAAEKLKERIQALKSNIVVEQLSAEGLTGESMQEMFAWITRVFLPVHEHYPNYRWILNATGGTKIMPMALEKAIQWDEIHYKAFNDAQLQRWVLPNTLLDNMPLPQISPLEALKTYTEIEDSNNNSIDQYAQAVIIAQKIWDFYSAPRENNPHIMLSERLNAIWGREGRENEIYNQKSFLIPWTVFQDQGVDIVDITVLKNWCQQLSDFSQQGFTLDEDGLVIPANKPEKSKKDWKNWISGLWLETLITHWLIEDVGFKQEDVAKNVKLTNHKRELDFVFLHKSNLQVIEAKAAPSDEAHLNEIVRQIKSVTEVGKLTNYLVISPYFEKIVNNEQRMKDFEYNCQANQIKIIKNKEGLLKAFT
jgi:hypothetical protein